MVAVYRFKMPPIRKSELDKHESQSRPYLSKSAGGSSFRTSFDESTRINLSSSCFSAIRTEKGDPDDDLTSLNWLQNNDILKGFEVSATVPPMSPPRDSNGDILETPPRGGQAKGPLSPDTLANKRKSPSKPPYSFSSLIFMAIEEAPSKKLPVKDIYNWIMDHFPYFRDARLGWKNSVRHNLSLNKCFKKVDKDKGQVSLKQIFQLFQSVTFLVDNRCGQNQLRAEPIKGRFLAGEGGRSHRRWNLTNI